MALVQRQSNIELLRIFAMLLVLILHANGLAIGLPEQADCISRPVSSFLRFSIESLCIICVNVYVLISGWFGINATPRKLAGFIFTCLFYSLLLTGIIWTMKGFPALSFKTLAGCFLFGQEYWFANSYLLLYIVSPALNSLFMHSDRKTVRFTVCAFLLVMVSFGWLHTMPEFKYGYSTISFIGLYMLGRYMRLYIFGRDKKVIDRKMALAGYFACVFLLTLMAFVVFRGGSSYVVSRCVFSYLNPLTMGATVFLFLFFRELKFNSHFVNTIARSTFAVYLFHLNPFVWERYLGLCRDAIQMGRGLIPMYMALIVIVTFAMGVLLDQVRIKCWNQLDQHLPVHTIIEK